MTTLRAFVVSFLAQHLRVAGAVEYAGAVSGKPTGCSKYHSTLASVSHSPVIMWLPARAHELAKCKDSPGLLELHRQLEYA